MELVSVYLQSDYCSLFQHVKSLWQQNQIIATPEMATLIEKKGITRKTYNEERLGPLNTRQDYYKMCLSLLIFLIDNQHFDKLDEVFMNISQFENG